MKLAFSASISGSFDKDTQLWIPHHNQETEPFYPPTPFSWPLWKQSLLPLLGPGNRACVFCPCDFAFPKIASKERAGRVVGVGRLRGAKASETHAPCRANPPLAPSRRRRGTVGWFRALPGCRTLGMAPFFLVIPQNSGFEHF